MRDRKILSQNETKSTSSQRTEKDFFYTQRKRQTNKQQSEFELHAQHHQQYKHEAKKANSTFMWKIQWFS